MKLLGAFDITDEGVLLHKWPEEITVDYRDINTVMPHISVGRHGAINVLVKNGAAHYWRTEDIPGPWLRWRYRLESSIYREPVPA